MADSRSVGRANQVSGAARLGEFAQVAGTRTVAAKLGRLVLAAAVMTAAPAAAQQASRPAPGGAARGHASAPESVATGAGSTPRKEPAPDVKGSGFVPLFGGKTLEGWRRVNGSATYHVADGCIVGVCDPASKMNTFLRTERTYRDFILVFDVRFDVPGNSGVQFRSQQRDGDGRVFGYQCEIDQRPERRWSGGIYDEGRRAWLNDLAGEANAKAREAFRYDDWNTFIIQARGRRLQTWVNGVPCADYTDADAKDFTPEGFIALQVHAGKEGKIRWRNIRIRELDTATRPAGQ